MVSGRRPKVSLRRWYDGVTQGFSDRMVLIMIYCSRSSWYPERVGGVLKHVTSSRV